MNKCLLMLLLVFSCLFMTAGEIMADGMIFPIDPEERMRPVIIFSPPVRPTENFTVPLSVNRHHVKISINSLAASTEVDQVFYNHENRTIEGLYIFPLPTEASISGFAMDIEGKMTKGELLDADKAKKIYEDIVRQMRDPGLLEYMGKGLFKTRIYPINALSEKKVKLSYQQALKMEGNLVRYVYPLDIDRYATGPMKDVAIQGTIKSDVPITSIYSPTHKISIDRKSDKEVVIGFETDSLKPEKDFVLYYAVSKKDLSVSVISHRPDMSEDGTFMLMLAPTIKAQAEKTPAIDVALVMDTSGSMAGQKFEQAQKALEFCINSLSEGSRFFLCNFSTEANAYKPELTEINKDTRSGALNFIKNLDAIGGTNISEALELSIKALNKNDSKNPRFIVFVTDGKPTAGITEADDILKEVRKLNESGIRIFSFGVGSNLNATLIDSLAEENGGVSDYVAEEEDMEIKISSLFSKLTYPVLSDVDLQFANVEVTQIYPRKVHDLFKDSNILILGRYSKPGAALITLTGRVKDERVKLDFEADFPAQESENAFVAKIWATRKIGFLLDQIRKNGADEELKNEIITLAKRFGILTPYTSFLVLEDQSPERINLRQTMAPSGGFRDDELKAESERFSVDRLQSLDEGADAIGASREMNSLKSAAEPSAPSFAPHYSTQSRRSIKMPDFKEINGKTFYLIDDVWVDSEVKDQKTDKTYKTWSDAYFAMIQNFPPLGKYFALGEKVIVKFGKMIIEINPERGIENP
ncbi:MAG: VIT domain-containing protein [Candidatus Riflebacteria bacterium]